MTQKILITKITPAPFQPRKSFDPEKLQELADSMREQGLIQPIMVRPHGDGFQLIAGERRFRAAKILGWKEIRAEVCPMDNIEAQEKSVVENVHRGDLEGEELENAIDDLWQKGNPDTGDGRYTSKIYLSKRLGMDEPSASNLISAKKARERLGLKKGMLPGKNISTRDLMKTAGIENDSERKTLLEKTANGTIQAKDIAQYAQAIKNSPIDVKDAVLDKPKMFTPSVAAEISKLPEESHKGTIAAIKKGKMDEEDALDFVKDVHQSTPSVQKAMSEEPSRFTPSVVKEITKIKTPDVQKVTVDTIRSQQLGERDAIELISRVSDYIPITAEQIALREAQERAAAESLKQWEMDYKRKFSSSGRKKVMHAFENVSAFMALSHTSRQCSCPHCGKNAHEHLKFDCCDAAKHETLDKAFEYAKRRHEEIVKEESGKTVAWSK